MRHLFSSLRNRALITLNRATLPVSPRSDIERLGSKYGGWSVPTSLLNKDSICYLVGAGEDVSFDLAVAKHFGCSVHCFDPTPRAKVHVDQVATGVDLFHFHPWGVWGEDTTMKFYAPADETWVSHSIVNLQKTDTYFEAECKTLPTIMGSLGHNRIDLLKMDVEGAEYEVLESLLSTDIRPTVLCIEFDQPVPHSKTRSMVRRLLDDYTLYEIDGWNYHFLLRDAS